MNFGRIRMVALGILTNLFAFGLVAHPQQSLPKGLEDLPKSDCHTVMIIGAVRVPSRFDLQRPTRLAELIRLAGGPDIKAGRTLRVMHTGMASVCSGTTETNQNSRAELSEDFDLAEVVQGKEKANPWMKHGDVVVVAQQDVVYVMGQVKSPQTFVLRSGMTLTQAVALAGGPWMNSKLVRVRLMRFSAEGNSELKDHLILRELQTKPSVDPMLRANDNIEVSDERGLFGHGRRLNGLVVRAELPVQVVK